MAALLRPIFVLQTTQDVQIHVKHIPGEDNIVADALSRGSQEAYTHLDAVYQVDCPTPIWRTLYKHDHFTLVATLDSVGCARRGGTSTTSSRGTTSTAASWTGIFQQLADSSRSGSMQRSRDLQSS